MSGPAITCPRCNSAIAPAQIDAEGMVACTCGYHGYAGYVQEYAYLDQRRRWLWDRIVEQAPPPDPVTARQYGIWPVTTSGPVSAPRPPGPGSTQVLLIVLGAGLLILAGLVFVAVAWDLIGPYGQIVMVLVATLVAAGTALALRQRAPRSAEALAVVAFGLAAITALAAPALEVVPQAWTSPDRPYWLVVAVLLALAGLGLGALTGLRAWTWLGWLTVPLALAAALGVLYGWLADGRLEVTIAALAFLALAAALMVDRRHPAMLVAGAFSLVTTIALTIALLAMTPPYGAIVTIAAALLLLLVLSERIPGAAWIGWPLLGLWLMLLGTLLPDSLGASVGLAVAGAGLLFWLARDHVGLGMLAAGVLWTSWIMHSPGHADVVLAVAAVALYGLALRRAAAPVAWIGALCAQAALLLRWQDSPVFEGPTLAFAALLLGAGLLQRRAGEQRSSIVYGPAVTFALIPSSLLVWVDVWAQPALIRFGVVMVCGVALLLLGVRRRMLGLVVPSAIAVSIAATAQIFATLDLLPRWLALGIAGALLILVGARIEWVRSKRAETSAWLQSLN